jgi:hypothetical protein
MTAVLFPLGRIVATPGALSLLATAGVDPAELLHRHQSGDWGEVPAADARENELSVKKGFRVLSSYRVGQPGARISVITEADRSSTCLLLCKEY